MKEGYTEEFKKLSPTGKHSFVKKITKEPTCTEPGKYDGGICEYCKMPEPGNTDWGDIPAKGHLVDVDISITGGGTEENKKLGSMDVTVYVSEFKCNRCSRKLGTEVHKVYSYAGRGGKFAIVEGKKATINDLSNGIHVDGNMKDDGGVWFNGRILDQLKSILEKDKSRYDYIKTKANSFFITFSDEFLAEQADGTYDLYIINGEEFWPMTVTIKDHKLASLSDMTVPEVPKMTEDELNARIAGLVSDGAVLKEEYLGCPEREYKPGDISGDGIITVDDARLALRAAVKLEQLNEPQISAADVDADGSVTVDDARDILRVAVKLDKAENFKAVKK